MLSVSRISDKEHTTSSLGDGVWKSTCSDVLSIKDSPGDAIPDFNKGFKEISEGTSTISCPGSGKDSRDIFPDDPTGADSRSKAAKFEGQVATVIIQSLSESGDAE